MGVLVGLILFITFSACVVVVAATGHDRRGYRVSTPDTQVKVSGEIQSIANIAETYQPKMFLSSSVQTPSLLWVFYEAIPNDQTIDLIFYHVWENEIYHRPFIHHYYALFRAVYYGYPLYDIEYFQISVSRQDGSIQRLNFETSPVDDFYALSGQHVKVYLERGAFNYFVHRNSKGGKKTSGDYPGVKVQYEKRRLLVGVQTWNHASCLIDETCIQKYDRAIEAPLKPLSAEEYRRYKFVRKSQGTYKTQENRLTFFFARIVKYLCIIAPSRCIHWLNKKQPPSF